MGPLVLVGVEALFFWGVGLTSKNKGHLGFQVYVYIYVYSIYILYIWIHVITQIPTVASQILENREKNSIAKHLITGM